MATNNHSTSLIFALHTRYEKAWLEYQLIEASKIGAQAELKIKERADEASRQVHARVFQLEEAEKRSSAEEVALNRAILYQVPTTWQEALILGAHLKIGGIDEGLEGSALAAVETGFDTLLDFMFGEIDHEELDCAGEQLLNIAKIVCDRRRLRTGKVEA